MKYLIYFSCIFVFFISSLIILQIDRCPDPAGLLRVEIVQALDLMAMDKRLTAKDTSDPYAVFGIGENEHAFRVG